MTRAPCDKCGRELVIVIIPGQAPIKLEPVQHVYTLHDDVPYDALPLAEKFLDHGTVCPAASTFAARSRRRVLRAEKPPQENEVDPAAE